VTGARRRGSNLNATPRRRVLFVLRGKLGDSIAAFATVRAYADAFPADAVTLLVRANYAPLFAREPGLRVIGFSSRLAMFSTLAWLRWTEPAFDALLVLLGAGPPIRRLGRMVRAQRKIFLDGRFPDVYPEWPEIPEPHLQSEPAWRVARLFEPGLAQPQASHIASLAARRRPSGAIGIAPVSDEPRRSMSAAVLRALVESLHREHPRSAIHVLVNPADQDAKALRLAGLPAGAEFREFPTLEALFEALAVLDHLHSTDTGLYHLAAAMGVPLTVYFGPTQPWRNGFPAQPALAKLRLAALGGEHCEEKGCLRPACLELAVSVRIGAPIASDIDGTPRGCLLRAHPPQDLRQLKVDTAPDPGRDGARAVPLH
jgi:ADP-heptose:LPS heptosyltransferase